MPLVCHIPGLAAGARRNLQSPGSHHKGTLFRSCTCACRSKTTCSNKRVCGETVNQENNAPASSRHACKSRANRRSGNTRLSQMCVLSSCAFAKGGERNLVVVSSRPSTSTSLNFSFLASSSYKPGTTLKVFPMVGLCSGSATLHRCHFVSVER